MMQPIPTTEMSKLAKLSSIPSCTARDYKGRHVLTNGNARILKLTIVYEYATGYPIFAKKVATKQMMNTRSLKISGTLRILELNEHNLGQADFSSMLDAHSPSTLGLLSATGLNSNPKGAQTNRKGPIIIRV